jgi:hypothetical protein
MRSWKSVLKADPTEWLLEEDNPSVRYLTLVDLLEKPIGDPEVIQARADIMAKGIVPRILAKQGSDGCWDNRDRLYVSKYKGTVWQLINLAEHHADPQNPGVRDGCEAILKYSQDFESGGFSMHYAVKTGGGRHSEVIPCLTGNMVWSLIRFGYLSDPRVQRGINWIAKYQRYDDGIKNPPQGWPYDRYEMCWGKHSCHMGVVKALKALAEIPLQARSTGVQCAIKEGAEYMFQHHIQKRSHNLSQISKPGWLRFCFPLMYQTDVLEILGILTKLGCKDERMREAVDVVLAKQDVSGKWKLADTFNGRFQVDMETKGAPSKWITLKALTALKRYYS